MRFKIDDLFAKHQSVNRAWHPFPQNMLQSYWHRDDKVKSSEKAPASCDISCANKNPEKEANKRDIKAQR